MAHFIPKVYNGITADPFQFILQIFSKLKILILDLDVINCFWLLHFASHFVIPLFCVHQLYSVAYLNTLQVTSEADVVVE